MKGQYEIIIILGTVASQMTKDCVKEYRKALKVEELRALV